MPLNHAYPYSTSAARRMRTAAKVIGGTVSTPTLMTAKEELQIVASKISSNTGRAEENVIMP